MESPALKTLLAARIANRDTELHRAFDRYQAQYTAAIRDEKEAFARRRAANTGLDLCRLRAAEQGYPDLLTL